MELIPINNNENGEPTVSLRDLWTGLESKQQFGNWKDDRMQGLIEGQDYLIKLLNRSGSTRGRGKRDYIINLDIAKSIAMLERNEKGQQIRNYFIEAEKKSRSMQPKELSMSDICRAYLEQDAKHKIEKKLIQDKREATVMSELAQLSTDAEIKKTVKESQRFCKGFLNPTKVAKIGKFQSNNFVNKTLCAMGFQYILPEDERNIKKKIKGEWVTFKRKFAVTGKGNEYACVWMNNVDLRVVQHSLRWSPKVIDLIDSYINEEDEA